MDDVPGLLSRQVERGRRAVQTQRMVTNRDASLDDSRGFDLDLGDVVETALARALALAAEAGRWEIVARIAEELAMRRHAVTRTTADRRPIRSSAG